MIQILLVDDQELFRLGVSHLLSDIVGVEVVAHAQTGEEAIKLAQEKRPDMVLMDLNMPGMGGIEAIHRLLRDNPKLKIIVLSVHTRDPYPSKLLKMGVSGYLPKGVSADELTRAIRAVYSGERHLSTEVAKRLALHKLEHGETVRLEGLSDRELQVLIMITAGEKNQDISDKLCVSPKTVNTYRYRIYDKLRVTSDVDLTHYAMRFGLIDPQYV